MVAKIGVARREGESEWHVLRDGMVDALTVWDTTTVPDGRYSLRVTATDAPSNVSGRAKRATSLDIYSRRSASMSKSNPSGQLPRLIDTFCTLRKVNARR